MTWTPSSRVNTRSVTRMTSAPPRASSNGWSPSSIWTRSSVASSDSGRGSVAPAAVRVGVAAIADGSAAATACEIIDAPGSGAWGAAAFSSPSTNCIDSVIRIGSLGGSGGSSATSSIAFARFDGGAVGGRDRGRISTATGARSTIGISVCSRSGGGSTTTTSAGMIGISPLCRLPR